MNHDPCHPSAIEIPTCWSPEQALVIADFLGDIIAAIWRVYASDITRYLEHAPPRCPPGSDAINRLDDDIPF